MSVYTETVSETVTETATEPARETVAPCSCGELAAPDGVCLNIGACSRADSRATRGAARSTAKYSVPAAWNSRGSVD
jgi:hypothetical protein